jgi:hypothetical protein
MSSLSALQTKALAGVDIPSSAPFRTTAPEKPRQLEPPRKGK